jgi:prenyltransferase beta subunit
MDVEWKPPARPAQNALGGPPATMLALVVGVAVLSPSAIPAARASAPPAPRAVASRPSLSREVAYLAASQNAGGGFGAAPGQASSELYTAWAAMGLAAAGRNPATLRRGGRSVLDALRAQAATLHGPGDLERTILALHACGAPAGSIAGKNLISGLVRYRASDGSFGRLLNITAFAVFALRAAGHSARDRAVAAAGRWIAGHQDADGGYNFAGRGGTSDVDDTAAALQALLDAGIGGGAVTRAVAFIERAQNPDGGFPAEPHRESNAQSTAWAVQGLVAAGRNVEAVRSRGSRSPVAYLQSLVASNGSVRYSRTSAQTPVWVTAQALAALALKPFPVGVG